MSRPPYPHKCKGSMDGSTIFHAWTCRCGARPDIYSAETARDGWGCNCPVALRERIADIEAAARADQSLRSVAAHAAGMQPSSADDPEWPPRWEAIASVRISKAEAERDEARKDLAALRDYLTRSVSDDTTVHDAWDILHNLAPEDLARVLKWVEEIDGRPKGDVHIPMDLYHRLLSAGLKDAEGDVLEWITARVERCAEVESEATRLRDLVRHQRGPLHDAELITDAEYAALASDDGAVARLRRYDEMRREMAEAADPDNRHRAMLDWRGVSVPCPRCAGSGRCGYANTSTWRGGPGGQMLTDDVCDACWGSGDAERHGADLRALHAHSASIHKGVADALEARAKEVANDRAFGSGNELRARLAARDGWAGGLREAARIVRGA